MTPLILKRASASRSSGQWSDDDYDVLENGQVGEVVFRHACKLGLEGIVPKRKDSPFRSGRSPDWLKMREPGAAPAEREARRGLGRDQWR
jgi:bifunctional non-homologous end joining protein LigD